jgi:hypothetical protein
MRDVYKKDIDILFSNITEFLGSELEDISGQIENSDYKSIQIKSTKSNDFGTIFSLAEQCDILITRVKSLLKDFRTDIPLKIGIITTEESDKKHPFRSNLPSEEMDKIPDILISDRTSVSVIENYEVRSCGLKNIWTTTGVEISRSRKIRNIYFNRDEEDVVENFITGTYDEKILYVWGEKGSGKSGIIKEVTGRTDISNIIFLRERKHNTREFKIVHDLMYNLLFVKRSGESVSIDDVVQRIENSILPVMNKTNLIYFVNLLFGDPDDDDLILFRYGTYKISLNKALTDCIKINPDPYTVIIDDHQWVTRNCEQMIFDLFGLAQGRLKLVLCSDDKNNSNNITYPVKFLNIGDMNKVQISKMLQMLFPGMKIAGKTADFIHRATGGNLYTVIEFTQYLTNKEYFSIVENKVCINYPDMKNIPDNLTDMFHEKVASLSPNASDILKIISIMGDEFYTSDLDWLLHVINYTGDEQLALKELDDRGLIESIGDHYAVSEMSVLSEIYKSVIDKNKKLIHGLLGELFESKGPEKFGFKTFLHFLKAENYDKLISILPEIVSKAHAGIHFNALRNMLEIADKFLFKLCVKENTHPIEIWLNNLKFSKYLFDSDDPLDTVKRFEKAIDHLIKIEKNELTLDLYDILLRAYIESDKFKKAVQYIKTGLETAEKYQSVQHKLTISVLDLIIKLKKGEFAGIKEEFLKLEADAAGNAQFLESEDFLYIKARSGLMSNETGTAHETFTKLLEKYTAALDFTKAGEITRLMVEISLKLRDYKSAEEFCKNILSAEKDSPAGSDEFVRTNILLARLYGYQNKFLQAVSLLESLSDRTKKPELKTEIFYELGSIYQFHNEKDLALSTFKKVLDKRKPSKASADPVFEVKCALILASMQDYETAADYLKKCTGSGGELCKVTASVIRFMNKRESDAVAESLIKSLPLTNTVQTDLIFETALLMLNNMAVRRKFGLCRELYDIMAGIVNDLKDYNLVLEFNKAGKMLHRSAAKTKKNITNIRKVTPSVRKRVKNRRNS